MARRSTGWRGGQEASDVLWACAIAAELAAIMTAASTAAGRRDVMITSKRRSGPQIGDQRQEIELPAAFAAGKPPVRNAGAHEPHRARREEAGAVGAIVSVGADIGHRLHVLVEGRRTARARERLLDVLIMQRTDAAGIGEIGAG